METFASSSDSEDDEPCDPGKLTLCTRYELEKMGYFYLK